MSGPQKQAQGEQKSALERKLAPQQQQQQRNVEVGHAAKEKAHLQNMEQAQGQEVAPPAAAPSPGLFFGIGGNGMVDTLNEDNPSITLSIQDIARFCARNGVPCARLEQILPDHLMRSVAQFYEQDNAEYYASIMAKERAELFQDFTEACTVMRESIARVRSLARAFRRSLAFEGDIDNEAAQVFDSYLDEYDDVRLVLSSSSVHLQDLVGRNERESESEETESEVEANIEPSTTLEQQTQATGQRQLHEQNRHERRVDHEADGMASGGEEQSHMNRKKKKSDKRKTRVKLDDDTSEMRDDRPDRPPSPGDIGGSGRWRPTMVSEITATASMPSGAR